MPQVVEDVEGVQVLLIAFLMLGFPLSCALFSSITQIGDEVDGKMLLRREQSIFSHKVNSGYIKKNGYDWLNGVWTGSVFVPIGTCIKTESVRSEKNSFRMEEVLDTENGQLVLVKASFTSANCTRLAVKTSRVVLDSRSNNQIDVTTRVVAGYEGNNTHEPHIVIKSYLSSDGCTGPPAQIELFRQSCSVHREPLNSYGTFECDHKAQVAVFTRHGSFNNTVHTYPDCRVPSDIERETDEYPVTTVVQPLECTQVNTNGVNDDDDSLVLFQTIECRS